MNLFQQLMHKMFGREYVLLVHHDGDKTLCRMYQLGAYFYAHPYLPNTRVRLIPRGKVDGQPYIIGWHWVTPKSQAIWEKPCATPPLP